MKNNQAIFIAGIDTDAGKTYATAFIARKLMNEGYSVITQKFIQTGCVGYSEDIATHRRLLGTGLLEEDAAGLTAPIIFSYPASAQLAARKDGCTIDLRLIDRATDTLLQRYDRVLIEGAGGLMVPITDNFFTIDYVTSRELPMILVTNGKLGSINHTILSLEAIAVRKIKLEAVVYNRFFDTDPELTADTPAFIRRYLTRHFPDAEFIEMN